MDLTTAILTALGLAGAAGLNAYVPLLVVGLLGRAEIITVPAPYVGITSTPALAVVGVLFAVEFLADKVPGVDSVNDIVQTAVRPLAGALLAAGSIGIGTDLPAWVGVVAGVLAAGGVHATKAAARPLINVATAGAGGPVVSVVEDIVSVVGSVLALLAPVLLLVLVLVGVLLARRWWSRRRAARGAGAGA